MWFFKAPSAVVSLLALALIPAVSGTLHPVPRPTAPARLDQSERLRLALAKRSCGNPCGYEGWLCCGKDEQCFTDANQQASCTNGLQGGGWIFSTFYVTAAETVTKQSVWSSFVAAPTGSCGTPCGSACCAMGEYCASKESSSCKALGGSSLGGAPGFTTGIVNPSPPLRPTSSGVIVITATGSATATVPFATPISTGVNGTLVESNAGGGGLSGGAIAGIVIGVIIGLILLLLLCFYCCAKALFDTILAIFGLGKKKKSKHTHEETTYIESHHSGAAAGGRWYGQSGSSRPSRPSKKKESSGLGKMLGVGAGVAGLAALLGMKKKHDDRKSSHHDDKSTTVTDSSYYYSDYTSSSSASSDDRRTRHTRHSSRR